MAFMFPALSGKNNLIEENFQQKQQREHKILLQRNPWDVLVIVPS